MNEKQRKMWKELVFATEGYIGPPNGGYVSDQDSRDAILVAAAYIKELEVQLCRAMFAVDAAREMDSRLAESETHWEYCDWESDEDPALECVCGMNELRASIALIYNPAPCPHDAEVKKAWAAHEVVRGSYNKACDETATAIRRKR